MALDSRTRRVCDRAWRRFRGQHGGVQALACVVLWPLVLAVFLARSPALGRTGVPAAIAVAVLLTPGWVTAVGGALVPPDAPPVESSAPAGAAPGRAARPSVVEATVVSVVDGDTARMRMAGGEESVRFIGVDTPETNGPVEPYGREASEYTRRALAGRSVHLELDVDARDRYGRLLAYVWLAEPGDRTEAELRERLFNARLLLDGYAQLLTVPPNVRYVDLLTAFQAEAREAGRGLWAPARTEPTPIPATPRPARIVEPTTAAAPRCHPSYRGACLKPESPDYDCLGGRGNGPDYTGRVEVVGPDEYGLDRDEDGVGCE